MSFSARWLNLRLSGVAWCRRWPSFARSGQAPRRARPLGSLSPSGAASSSSGMGVGGAERSDENRSLLGTARSPLSFSNGAHDFLGKGEIRLAEHFAQKNFVNRANRSAPRSRKCSVIGPQTRETKWQPQLQRATSTGPRAGRESSWPTGRRAPTAGPAGTGADLMSRRGPRAVQTR